MRDESNLKAILIQRKGVWKDESDLQDEIFAYDMRCMSDHPDAGESQRATETARKELKSIFERDGLRQAVVFLNSLTNHRFTSVYRFDGPNLRNITFYDRENPQVDHCDDLPVLASYCIFVRELGVPFHVSHAARDERVKDHPKQKSVQRYCGVPLLDTDGKMFGTICHFDLKPGAITSLDIDLLEYLGDRLRSKLEVLYLPAVSPPGEASAKP